MNMLDLLNWFLLLINELIRSVNVFFKVAFSSKKEVRKEKNVKDNYY